MDKKTLLAIVICVGIWLVWTMFFMETPKDTASTDGGVSQAGKISDASSTKAEKGTANKAAKENGGSSEYEKEKPPEQRPEEKTVILKNSVMVATFTSRGAALKELLLPEYKERDEKKKTEDLGPENLISIEKEEKLPLTIRFRGEKSSFRIKKYSDWEIISKTEKDVVFRYMDKSDQTVPTITKKFSIKPDSYVMNMEVTIENRSDSSATEQIMVDLYAMYAPSVQTGCAGAPSLPRTPMCMNGENVIPSSSGCGSATQMKPGESKEAEPNINWTAINEQYFVLAVIPLDAKESVCHIEAMKDNSLVSSVMYPEKVIPPGASETHEFEIFAGPKKMSLLRSVKTGSGADAKLSATVDYGWFSFLCHPMLWLLKIFYSFLGNYGLAIILLTIVIKIVLLPLTNKSMKSMAEMSKLKPLMEELKKKYGDDKQKLNQEMMELYKTHHVNPMGGCFPMLLQMPIWIALYRMLYSSVELYQAPFIPGWLSDLSFKDPYYILPVILGAAMFLQQHLSPTSADSQQAKMMKYLMPAFMTFIMINLPSGLVLYILINSVLSIFHQMYYNKKILNTAVVTES